MFGFFSFELLEDFFLTIVNCKDWEKNLKSVLRGQANTHTNSNNAKLKSYISVTQEIKIHFCHEDARMAKPNNINF